MKVLIVDDSRGMRMMIRRAIRQAGFEADFEDASNGQEGLEKHASFGPNLIISDWNMPVMDGLTFLTEVKKSDPSVHFGFVTSQSTPDMQQKAKQAGSEFLISKPFTPEVFRLNLSPFFS